MNTLIIDTTSEELFLSLLMGDKEDRMYIGDCNSKHSVIMLPNIDILLVRNGLTVRDIDTFALSIGPGSFTGIRIGVSTVKAFAYAQNAKVITVNSLEANAYNHVNGNSDIVSIIDAKRNNAYYGKYKVVDGELVEEKLGFINKDNLNDIMSENSLLCSPKANSFDAVITENYYDGFVNLVKTKLAKGDYADDTFSPLYLKKSQAEEEADAV